VGVDSVDVWNFHGLGYRVLRREDALRAEVGSLSYSQWRHLAMRAMRAVPDGVWIDAADAARAISDFKVVQRLTPEEARTELTSKADASPLQQTIVELYSRYETALEKIDRLDFDDLVVRALRLLQEDEEARSYWQNRYDCVLVDEYQDIDPAQELLVQTVAAPQDNLYCVGDEDQCIYAWRHSRDDTVVMLDRRYPGLERHALRVNYRSGGRIVRLSRALIEHNANRFPKEIEAKPGADSGHVVLGLAAGLDAQAAHAARLADGSSRGEVAILARSTRALREAAIACARRGLKLDAPQRVLASSGVNKTLLAYLRLFANPEVARPEDVADVFRVPNRYLPEGSAELVATRLRQGRSFAEAIPDPASAEAWRATGIQEGAEFYDRLLAVSDAASFLRLIRTEGKLDRHYSEQQRLSGADQSDVDSLEAAEERARGMSVEEFADAFDYETRLVEQHLDSKDGIELRTIHGAKGLEWPHVIVVGVDDGEMPHRASLDGAGNAEERVKADEEERRLAYVAFTRAERELTILCDERRPSQYIAEASLRQYTLPENVAVVEAPKNPVRPAATEPRSGPSTETGSNKRNGALSKGQAERIIESLGVTRDVSHPAAVRVRASHPRAYEPWSQDEDAVLEYRNRCGATPRAIARELRRQPSAVRSRLRTLGLVPSGPTRS
jgi:superfamily I DNA/RNA helicase